MNFQTVKQANGQNIDMYGTVVELNGEGISPKSGKPYKKLTIVDDNNEKHLVTIRGDNLPTAAVLQQRQAFTISTWQQGDRSGFSGFWNPQGSVRQPQQGVQQAAQATNTGQKASQTPEIRIKAARIAAAAIGGTGVDEAPEIVTKIIDVAGLLIPWLETGQLPTFAAPKPQTFEEQYDIPPED